VHQRAVDLGLALNKILVPSNDVAGFIGNGHFMRDLLFACQLVEELKPDLGIAAAISWIDRITRDALIRPMGIFQLADYVGLDVCQKILHVMNTHIEGETLHSPFIDSCLAAGLRGGQEPDGSQRPGIFSYEKGRPRAIFQANGAYGEIPPLPHPIQPLKTWKTWKEMRAEADMSHALHAYFAQLWTQDDPSSELAKRYLCQSRKSAQTLLEHGVAKSADDVNKVLCYGFFHLYGPLSPCIPEGTLESPVQ
jgi:3-hydroxyacyl-CoA dehydrogenase